VKIGLKIERTSGRACGVEDCIAPPLWFTRCKGCRCPDLLCDEHWNEAQNGHNVTGWKCMTCGLQAKALSDMLDALQLIDI